MSRTPLNSTATQACMFAALMIVIGSLRQYRDRSTDPGTLHMSPYVPHSGTCLSRSAYATTFKNNRDLISGGYGDVRKDRLSIGSDSFTVSSRSQFCIIAAYLKHYLPQVAIKTIHPRSGSKVTQERINIVSMCSSCVYRLSR